MKIFKYLAVFSFLVILASCFSTKEQTDEKAKAALSGSRTTQEQQTKTILALGDSLTAWYGLEVEDAYPAQLENILNSEWYEYRVVNAGVSGDTSAMLLERLSWVLEWTTPPDFVLLEIGANDGLQGLSTVQLKKNVSEIIDELQKQNIKVILTGMRMPVNYGKVYRDAFEKVYVELAEEKNIPFYPFFLEGVAMNQKLNQWDKIHPTKEGYTIIVKQLFEYLKENDFIQK